MPLHIQTPLVESRPLSAITGRSVWLKLDAMQPSGSFKLRGIGAAGEHYVKVGKRRFVSSSGGNAGIAVAYVGRKLGVPVVVVVPESTTELAKSLIRQEDAEVIVHGATWMEANAHAQSLVDDATAFIHPFDNPLLWAGHASMIDEVAQAGESFDAVVLSVGGGGLMSGIVEGLDRNGLKTPVIAVETEGAASLYRAVEAGHPIELPAITSIATTLGAKQVCQQAFDLTRTHDIRCALVSDKAALTACARFLDDHRILVEPACGAALAMAYDKAPALDGFGKILMVVCGGATASLEQIRQWAAASS